MKKNVFFLCVLTEMLMTNASEKQLNFLFVIVDDMNRQSIKAYGNEICQTPNIDKLVEQGITFDGAYHMGSDVAAVCLASRTMIMTGTTLWNSAGNKQGLVCLAETFNKAGYTTMRTCKSGPTYKYGNSHFNVNKESTKRGSTDETGSAWHVDQVLSFLNEYG